MTTLLRRILAAALIAVLAGAAVVVTALLGRRPRKRVERDTEALVPVATPRLAPRKSGRGRGFAVGLVCLLLLTGLAGIVYESRHALLGIAHRSPNGDGKPLAALSPPDAGTAGTPAPTGESPTGSVQSPTSASTAAAPPARPTASPAPDFDVVRIEPNGDAVIAGRATPNASVELLVDGKPVGSARANADGRFTFMPPALPVGNSEIGLRATDETGERQRSTAHMAVVIEPGRNAKPLVAIIAPDKPTVILSQPDMQTLEPATEARREASSGDAMVAENRHAFDTGANLRGSEMAGEASSLSKEPGRREGGAPTSPGKSTQEPSRVDALDSGTVVAPAVVSIDAQDGGKLVVTARGAPGAAVRLYLNETLIAPATVGSDGTVTFTVGRGVKPGDYRVRLDSVDPATGKVRDRAEVPFKAPDPGHDGGVEYSAQSQGPAGHAAEPSTSERQAASPRSASDERQAGQMRPLTTGSLAANAPPGAVTGSSDVHIAGIETARIERGDSLWRISRRTYGEGERYTLIYDANKEQIRDPDLIYPGQVFVLPQGQDGDTAGDARPR
ncbi:LysM peptidoglycan-binding domain-containing protein [Methylobacterium komagatae]